MSLLVSLHGYVAQPLPVQMINLHSLFCPVSLAHTSEWLIFACNEGFLSLFAGPHLESQDPVPFLPIQMHAAKGVSLPFESSLQYDATKKAELRTEAKSQGLGRGKTQRW